MNPDDFIPDGETNAARAQKRLATERGARPASTVKQEASRHRAEKQASDEVNKEKEEHGTPAERREERREEKKEEEKKADEPTTPPTTKTAPRDLTPPKKTPAAKK